MINTDIIYKDNKPINLLLMNNLIGNLFNKEKSNDYHILDSEAYGNWVDIILYNISIGLNFQQMKDKFNVRFSSGFISASDIIPERMLLIDYLIENGYKTSNG